MSIKSISEYAGKIIKTIKEKQILDRAVKLSKFVFSFAKKRFILAYAVVNKKTKIIYNLTKENAKSFLNVALPFMKKTKKIWIATSSCVAVLLITITSSIYTLALKVEVGGEVVGFVTNEQEYLSAISKMEDEVSQRLGDDFSYNKIPVFSYSIVEKNKVVSEQEIYEKMVNSASQDLNQAYQLKIDGQDLGIFIKDSQILNYLDSLLDEYKHQNPSAKVDFANDIQLIKGYYSVNEAKTKADLENLIKLSNSSTVYVVKKGDTASIISQNTGLSITQLVELNPSIDFTNLYPEQIVLLTSVKKLLNVSISKTETYNQSVPYSSDKIYSSDIYEGTIKVKVAGENGINEVVAETVYVNGVEVSRNIISNTVIKQPVKEQIVEGIKKVAPSGKFIWPVTGRYVVSSPFGMRYGKLHPAIDIPAPKGTPAVAADSGTVISAGYVNDGGGNTVTIDHGGSVTRYLHLSSISVTVGQKVSQGQTIGLVGSTGYSTGSHLHFEIIINGNAVNPISYLLK